jgi:hypothetical protein
MGKVLEFKTGQSNPIATYGFWCVLTIFYVADGHAEDTNMNVSVSLVIDSRNI